MNSELSAVLTDLRSLAEQRGWSPVAGLAGDLLAEKAGSAVLVAAAAEVETAAFERWLAANLPGARVTAVRLEDLAEDPAPALKAEKCIALFECGRLVEAGEVEAIAGAFFGRPAGSYAIVLAGAELIDDEEELDLVQKGVWRLLVPGPKPDWGKQDLLEHHCYLWSAGEPHAFLRLRVQRDVQSLGEWLRAPLADADGLAREGALYALDLADEQLRRGEREGHEAPPVHQQRIVEALETLSELRRRLVRRLDADAASIERQLTASLQTLEQDLLHDLRPHLQGVHRHSSFQADDLRQALTRFISDGVGRWQEGAQELIVARSGEIVAEVESLLTGMDWAVVNELAPAEGKEPYPRALLDGLTSSPEFQSLNGGFLGETAGADPETMNIPAMMRAALAGTVVLAMGGLLLGPAGFVAAGVTAVISAALLDRKVRHERSLREAEAYGRSAVRGVVRQSIATVREQTWQAVKPLRERLVTELKGLEGTLEQALDAARRPVDAPSAGNPDRELLAGLRSRAVAAGLVSEAPFGTQV
jgi:hypothetical protein